MIQDNQSHSWIHGLMSLLGTTLSPGLVWLYLLHTLLVPCDVSFPLHTGTLQTRAEEGHDQTELNLTLNVPLFRSVSRVFSPCKLASIRCCVMATEHRRRQLPSLSKLHIISSPTAVTDGTCSRSSLRTIKGKLDYIYKPKTPLNIIPQVCLRARLLRRNVKCRTPTGRSLQGCQVFMGKRAE